MDEIPDLTPFQQLLFDEYYKFGQRRKKIQPPISDFARWLKVKHTSLDHWMNGARVPDLANAVLLSDRLGVRVFEVLNYPPLFKITDPKLRYIILHWEDLTNEQQEHIDAIIGGTQE